MEIRRTHASLRTFLEIELDVLLKILRCDGLFSQAGGAMLAHELIRLVAGTSTRRNLVTVFALNEDEKCA